MAVTRYGRVATSSGERWARFDERDVALLDTAPWAGGRPTGETLSESGARLACPVTPAAIFGIGKNYRAHAAEMGGDVPKEPLVFGKSPSSVLGPGGVVLLPRESERVDYEGELGVVIGKRCRRVSREAALDHVFGYTVVCDVTARDLQKRDGQWARAKGFDTFCPVGPHVVTGIDASNLEVSLSVDGVRRQHATTADMVFDVPAIVSWVSSFTTLLPGDLIATGTPEGVGPLHAGNVVDVTVRDVGTLRFTVAGED